MNVMKPENIGIVLIRPLKKCAGCTAGSQTMAVGQTGVEDVQIYFRSSADADRVFAAVIRCRRPS